MASLDVDAKPSTPVSPSSATSAPSVIRDLAWTPTTWLLLVVLCGALPSIGSDLHMSSSSLQWIVSGYVLGYGGFLLLGGRAADLLGRRQVFLSALAAFAVVSLVGGLVSSAGLLIAARF